MNHDDYNRLRAGQRIDDAVLAKLYGDTEQLSAIEGRRQRIRVFDEQPTMSVRGILFGLLITTLLLLVGIAAYTVLA